MITDKKLIQKIIDSHKGLSEKLSGYIAESLNEIRETLNELKRLDGLDQKLQDRYKVEQAKISKKIKEIRKNCKHWKTTYHPDASGNNDSWTTCDICGAELNKSKEVRFY